MLHLGHPPITLDENFSCYLYVLRGTPSDMAKEQREMTLGWWLHLRLGWIVVEVNCIHKALGWWWCLSLAQSFTVWDAHQYYSFHVCTERNSNVVPYLPRHEQWTQRAVLLRHEHGQTLQKLWSNVLLGCYNDAKIFCSANFIFTVATVPNSHKLSSRSWLGYSLSGCDLQEIFGDFLV